MFVVLPLLLCYHAVLSLTCRYDQPQENSMAARLFIADLVREGLSFDETFLLSEKELRTTTGASSSCAARCRTAPAPAA